MIEYMTTLFYTLIRPEMYNLKVFQFGRLYNKRIVKNKYIKIVGDNLICHIPELSGYIIEIEGDFNYIRIGSNCILRVRGEFNFISSFDNNVMDITQNNNVIYADSDNNIKARNDSHIRTGRRCTVECIADNILSLGSNNTLKTEYVNNIVALGMECQLETEKLYVFDAYVKEKHNSIVNYREVCTILNSKSIEELNKCFSSKELKMIFPFLHESVRNKIKMMEELEK